MNSNANNRERIKEINNLGNQYLSKYAKLCDLYVKADPNSFTAKYRNNMINQETKLITSYIKTLDWMTGNTFDDIYANIKSFIQSKLTDVELSISIFEKSGSKEKPPKKTSGGRVQRRSRKTVHRRRKSRSSR
jgi:hypothetical protein